MEYALVMSSSNTKHKKMSERDAWTFLANRLGEGRPYNWCPGLCVQLNDMVFYGLISRAVLTRMVNYLHANRPRNGRKGKMFFWSPEDLRSRERFCRRAAKRKVL